MFDDELSPREPTSGMPAVLALWRDARAHGWDVHADPLSAAWQAEAPGCLAGMKFDPTGPVSVGVVGAYDERRTLTLTGVDAAGDAVDVLRGFFGWPSSTTPGISLHECLAPFAAPLAVWHK